MSKCADIYTLISSVRTKYELWETDVTPLAAATNIIAAGAGGVKDKYSSLRLLIANTPAKNAPPLNNGARPQRVVPPGQKTGDAMMAWKCV